MESLAAGPISFDAGAQLWKDGAPVDRAFMIVAGTASFVPKRRNAGSTSSAWGQNIPKLGEDEVSGSSMSSTSNASLGDNMTEDALKVAEDYDSDSEADGNEGRVDVQLETLFNRSRNGIVKSMTEASDFADLSNNLQRRAELVTSGEFTTAEITSYEWEQSASSLSVEGETGNRRHSLARKESRRAMFDNKVLGRIHSRGAYTGGLVFSRGHFLGDISRMFQGHVNTDLNSSQSAICDSSQSTNFGFSRASMNDKVIQDDDIIEDHKNHTSTLIVGKDGCVVLVFEKASLIPFLDEYPGLLLSLLGTQVVV